MIVKEYLSAHYILNCMACLLFVISKSFLSVCSMFYDLNDDGACQLDWRDTEILMFLCLVLVLKNKRWKPLSVKEFISNIFLFGKCASLLLFFRHDMRYAFLYSLLCLVLFLGFPEPSYSGPDNIMFLRGQALDDVLLHESDKIWFVEFYATWSTHCSRFSNIFATLSMEYSNEMFKFGKVDVTRYPLIATKYKVDSSVSSKNLPSLILFENGKEKMRRPLVDHKGVVSSYVFKKENVIRDFNLNDIYAATKKKLPRINLKDKKDS